MENKGMRVNMEETKLIVTGPCLDNLRDWCISMCCLSERCWSGEHNQVLAVQTLGAWEVSMVANTNYVCPRCLRQACPIDGRTVKKVDVDGTLLDVEASFCYLGYMLRAGGGCSLAIITRCCTAWGKFKKLLPFLTSKHISLTVHGKVFVACVRSAVLH